MKYDGTIEISAARRFSDPYVGRTLKWSQFLEKLRKSVKTSETHAEYKAMPKDKQNKIKDIGGFVGGSLSGTKRTKNAVLHRQLITLDVDNGYDGIFEDFTGRYNVSCCMYSTHSHGPDSPSYRIIIPTSRPMDPDEFEAVSRKIAESCGMDHFCKTSFVRHQVMFWPSASADVEPVWREHDAPWLDPERILDMYDDWRDLTQWPALTSGIGGVGRSQADPGGKQGLVGTFCRAYTISEAISGFLFDHYEESDVPGRYTYKNGSTANGAVVYDDKFLYSHHSSDPAGERLCNAFDLVRLHLFGNMDADAKEDTKQTSLPSYKEMERLCMDDFKTRRQVGIDKAEELSGDFEVTGEREREQGVVKAKKGKAKRPEKETEDEFSWMGEMPIGKNNEYECSRQNMIHILRNDPKLKGNFRLNMFDMREMVVKLPWRKVGRLTDYLTDRDMSALREYFESAYKMDNRVKLEDALSVVMMENRYHPIKQYIRGLKWDKVERLDRLFIDYLGAEDSEYVKTITRKALVAAVSRVFEPGIKFDHIITFIGPQGIGKSWIIGKLGKDWFSGNLGNIHTKEALENIQGAWLIEIGELSSFKRAEVEAVKMFVSNSVDRFRVAYGKRVESFPRQCVFFATTNTVDFLVDQTGNRRFWPINLMGGEPSKSVFDELNNETVDQLWAEAYQYYNEGEDLFLTREMEQLAKTVQKEHTEVDDRTEAIEDYLEMLLPENWDEMNIWERRNYIHGWDDTMPVGTKKRDRITAPEIWCELFKKEIGDMTTHNTKFIHQILFNMPGWEPKKIRVKKYGNLKGYVRL